MRNVISRDSWATDGLLVMHIDNWRYDNEGCNTHRFYREYAPKFAAERGRLKSWCSWQECFQVPYAAVVRNRQHHEEVFLVQCVHSCIEYC